MSHAASERRRIALEGMVAEELVAAPTEGASAPAPLPSLVLSAVFAIGVHVGASIVVQLAVGERVRCCFFGSSAGSSSISTSGRWSSA